MLVFNTRYTRTICLDVHPCPFNIEHISNNQYTSIFYTYTIYNIYNIKTHTLDKNWIIVVIRQELNPVTCN